MDFMFARAPRGGVVLAVFALRNERVWRDECDARNCVGDVYHRRKGRSPLRENVGQEKRQHFAFRTGFGGPKKSLHDNSY